MARNEPGAITDYVNMGDVVAARFLTAEVWSFLIFFRAENTAANYRGIVSKWSSTTTLRQLLVWIVQGAAPAALNVYVDETLILTGGANVALNTWYLMVLTNATGANGLKLNLIRLSDGVFLDNAITGTHPSNNSDLTHPIAFGCMNKSPIENPFDGDLAHATYITGKAVTQAEMLDFLACPDEALAAWAVGNDEIFHLPDLFTDVGPLGNDGTVIGTGSTVVADPAFSCGPPEPPELTGTATASVTEDDIVAGGKTIIITLTADTWIPV